MRNGAIKVFQTPAWKECQDDLMRHAESRQAFRGTRPGAKLTPEQKQWVIGMARRSYKERSSGASSGTGWTRFFEYLETKAYKMHIRVLLSKYRSYTECPSCGGARLKTDSLLWRIGSTRRRPMRCCPPAKRYLPTGVKWSRAQLEALPGLCLHDLMLMPLSDLRRFFSDLSAVARRVFASLALLSLAPPAGVAERPGASVAGYGFLPRALRPPAGSAGTRDLNE